MATLSDGAEVRVRKITIDVPIYPGEELVIRVESAYIDNARGVRDHGYQTIVYEDNADEGVTEATDYFQSFIRNAGYPESDLVARLDSTGTLGVVTEDSSYLPKSESEPAPKSEVKVGIV